MTPPRRLEALAAAASLVGFAALGACLAVTALAEPPSNPQPPSPNAELGFAPLTWFNNHCANCHGAYGSLYPANFGKSLTDAELVAKVEEMVTGPANTRLEAEPLQALVAFHRALIRKEAFVAATSQDRDFLSGEMSLGAKLTVLHGDDPPAIKIDGHTWTAALKGPLKQAIVVEAVLGDAASPSRFQWPVQRHSHGDPLPDPEPDPEPTPEPKPAPEPPPAPGER